MSDHIPKPLKIEQPDVPLHSLDDLVDFLTYTFLPLFLIWRVPGLLPDGCQAVLLLPLLASAYGFCQVSAKTDDGYRGLIRLYASSAFGEVPLGALRGVV